LFLVFVYVSEFFFASIIRELCDDADRDHQNVVLVLSIYVADFPRRLYNYKKSFFHYSAIYSCFSNKAFALLI
jgi:hypothetical protein